MEWELLDAFEAAKKAADAASSGAGGPAAVDRCVDALRQLRQMPVTMKNLVDTQAGKRLRYLKKHPQTKIQTLASDLLEHWKNIVVSETANNDKKNSSSGDKTSVKVEVKSEKTEIVKVEKISNGGTSSRSESFKVEKNDSVHRMKAEKVFKSELNTVGKGKCESIKVERVAKEEKIASAKKLSSTPTGPPKLTAMIKCNDPMRDKVRELLAEAFSRVSDETSKDNRDEVRNILDEVDSRDPIRMAVMVESVMFEKLGRSNGSQKLKYRSIMFNLKDGKNTDFRRRVLLGHVEPESLIDMTPEEMASDERKLSNKQIKEKALFECERGGPPKATTDQFKCGRCGQRKTTYYQLQTRSADEPMTTFVTCVNCNNHWKFC